MPDSARPALLFDLDGTFADTAPDLGAALNCLREDMGLAPVPLAQLRPFTSQGVRGMLHAGLGVLPGDAAYAELYKRYLAFYGKALCVRTTLFSGIDDLLCRIEANDWSWGIVTNKTQRFTLPLLEQLGYLKRAGCVVCGDSAPRAKPAVQPMHLACALLDTRAAACFYAGDDRRDVVAGQASGMSTIAVRYGYLGDDDPVENWGADYLVNHAAEIAVVTGLT